MWISEFFHSVQGEGKFTGVPSVFVRTSGCNLRCWFCDTPYTSWNPEGIHESWQTVSERVLEIDCEHVVITGGEPMLQAELEPLTHTLADRGRLITIETAGTVFRPVQAGLMSISPKLSNSTPQESDWRNRHEARRENLDVVRQLIRDYPYQLKFVIDQFADLREVGNYLDRLQTADPDCVWLMPQGTTVEELQEKTSWLEEESNKRGFHFCPRLHIELFGNTRGT